MFKKYKEFIIWLIKIVSVLWISIIFFIGFGGKYESLHGISRTLAVTLSSYAISFVLFTKIYGVFEIGEFKSKQVIYSTSLMILFTDIVAYLALMVMITNPNNVFANASFRLDNLHVFLGVLFLQVFSISVLTYLGNFIYFKLFSPDKTLIIYDSSNIVDNKIQNYLNQYKKQYVLFDSVDIKDVAIDKIIPLCDFVVITDMDLGIRKKIIDQCYLCNVSYAYTPTISDVTNMSGKHATYGDKPVVVVRVEPLTYNQRVIKRLMDMIISSIGIILTFPFWIIIAIAILVDDKGPIFFKQTRKTVNGIEFDVIKFRTMKVGSKNYSSTVNDDRITRIGKVLRKTRLDELPQLINILIGEMSVVGPRPEMLENIERYEANIPEFRYRLKVKAGLTGIAQIEGMYNTSPQDKLILDLTYIENYSVWLDVKLMFKTVVIFFKKDSTAGFEDDKNDNNIMSDNISKT